MDAQKVDMFILLNAKYFESYQLNSIRQQLLSMDESKWNMVLSIPYKDPTTILLVSLFAGYLGIDRILIGDVGLGIGKLITCGGFGVWALVDLFLIQSATREKNMNLLQQYL